MSKAFKCDRCGKLFEPHIGDGNIDVDVSEEIDAEGDRKLKGWVWEVCAGCMAEAMKVIETKP